MSDLEQRIRSLSPEKRALLLARLNQKQPSPPPEPIRRIERGTDDEFPLSSAQQRLWFLEQLEPGNPLYNVPIALRLRGALHADLLRRSLEEVVTRHEVLRARFIDRSGTPVQRIDSAAHIVWQQRDASGFASNEALQQYLTGCIRVPFDLSLGPLVRAHLLHVNEEEHILLLVTHHIACDGWSIDIVVRDLLEYYTANLAGRPASLPQLSIQYLDYAAWQQAWLHSPASEAQLAYWKQALSGDLPVLDLPLDHARSQTQTFHGAHYLFRVPRMLARNAKQLARQEHVTLFMLLLASFQVLLARYSGQTDILVGTPGAGRPRSELENVVGLFINTLVLRTDLSGNPCFREVLRRVRDVTLDAYSHQEMPFEQLVKILQPQRDLRHTPLFQAMFVLQNTPLHAFPPSRLQIEHVPIESANAKFDLTLLLEEDALDLHAILEYTTDLFEFSTIQRLANHWLTLLDSLVSDPVQAIWMASLLSEEEKQKILFALNATQRPFPAEYCLHQLFEAQVQRTPDAIAVIYAQQCLTYRELDTQANRLAHYLQQEGIAPEMLVGVCLARSPALIVTLLGILKAGAAYLPIDPETPPRRVTYLLSDARATLLLTDIDLMREDVPASTRILSLETLWPRLADFPAAQPVSTVQPENIAYILYTSGSTGAPKGVMIAHRGLVNYVSWALNMYPCASGHGVPVHTSIAFDLCVTSLFPALLTGQYLLLLPQESHGEALLESVQPGRDFSLVKLTPAHLELLNASGRERTNWSRALVIGGEALKTEALQPWRNTASSTRLFNEYGPTETVVGCCVYEVPAMLPGEGSVPIGVPIANMQAYVLDAYAQPVPFGVAGELYIGGVGVARGYLNRPDLTAEYFRPHPWSAQPGARLYKTGDRVRLRRDGVLEFLGRCDQQIKLRGFRVEPGEIAAVLQEHPSVRHCVVYPYEARPGENMLIAYVVPQVSQPASPELRQFLAARLPAYMLPDAFVLLDALPLTANGKVDTRALIIPDWQREQQHAVAPRTPTEEVLCAIWSAVLHRELVDVEANFFEIGGHSLLATQVIARIRQTFSVELPLRSLFEQPTVAGLASRIEQAMQAPGAGQNARLTLQLLPRVEPLPLSFGQQRLWFLDQLEPNSPLYIVPLAIRLRGPLVVEFLARSLTQVVQRHEVLRTCFPTLQGVPVQSIADEMDIPLKVIDLSALSEDEQETRLRQLVTQQARQPFTLSSGPLLRATLFCLKPQEHILLLTLHHIVSDGWSVTILFSELAACYAALSTDRPIELPPLPLQYADYALWQRHRLQGEQLEMLLQYWRQQLVNAPALLELPTDRPRPPAQSFRGAHYAFEISADLTDKLKTLSIQEHTTLFMTLLASFYILLARYSGQQDIIVGTPSAGRTHTQTEGLIGFFVNTLPLRVRLADTASFREVLQQVRQVALEAYAYQDLPFEYLVEALQIVRDLAHAPLFQVMFIVQNVPQTHIHLNDLVLEAFPVENFVALFDLTLSVTEHEKGLRGLLEYNTDLFTLASIQRLAEHWRRLLDLLVADPTRSIWHVSFLSVAQQQLLSSWSAGRHSFSPANCLHDLIEAQVMRTPEAVAVICQEQQLTYHQLYERASQLASHLQALGVGPDTPVGLCLQRSPELIVGMLGILKAGGFYIPIDPIYPLERITFMLHDSGAPILVTQSAFQGKFAAIGRQIVCLDADWEIPETQMPEQGILTPDHLAYLIYTSGSTGRPKGAMITHAALVKRVLAMSQQFALGPGDRQLQFVSSGFDISVEEIFTPLISGAAVVMYPAPTEHTGVELLQTCERYGVTKLNLPASYWHQLIEEIAASGQEVPDSLRVFVTGAERPSLEKLRAWKRLVRHPLTFFNVYGPTEATIMAAWYHLALQEVDLEHVAHLPIGHPLPDTSLYVLDRHMQLVPPGHPGELYIGGAGLMRGYWQRPDLTASCCLPDPYSGKEGARLYKTGDLVRYLPDGTLEFLGRVDQQVKIRGFRIELGEIEAVLARHETVKECVVLVRDDTPGGQQLVAYVVPQEARACEPALLRAFLQQHLPGYMVPTAFLCLEKFPLTTNNKLDRQALAALDWREWRQENTHELRTPTQELLGTMVGGLLHRERVGSEENFFEIGGHSLLAAQLVARIRMVFQVEISLRTLFEMPTIAELARQIEEAQHAGQQRPTLIQQEARDSLLPLSFAQQRLWFLDRLEPGNAAYSIPLALRLRGPLNVQALERSFATIAQRHEVVRTIFPMISGVPHQEILPNSLVRLPRIDLELYAESEREARLQALIGQQAYAPFDLSTGPLLRTTLFRLQEREHVLLITMHHIISDGWSLGILLRELGALYTAYSHDQPVALAELAIQYADYACWQRAWLQGDVLHEQIAYWRSVLADAPALLELPTDHPRPAVQTFHGARYPLVFPSELLAQLKVLCVQEQVTLFMALLAAFQVLLARYSGQEDILVGSPIAGRTQVQTEDLIGFFTNTLVFRTDLSGDPDFRELLARVRNVALGAYTHQDLPFERLVEELHIERDLSHAPLFQVMFALQNVPQPSLTLPGLEIRPVSVPGEAVQFDLTLSLLESGQELWGVLEYNTDLFELATISRMAEHFLLLLQQVVTTPKCPLSELSLLDESARRELLALCQGPTMELPAQTRLHSLFEAQVERTPDALAVICGDRRLTYDEVNELANRLATLLRSLHVGPETMVGMYMDAALEMLIGLLGILKAGAAYVPLDPAYPNERLAFILEDTRMPLLLTLQRLQSRLANRSTVRILCLDTDWSQWEAADSVFPLSQLQPGIADNLAYVIYTSGSTGRPKGVLVTHQNAVSSTLARFAQYSERVRCYLLLSSFAFDSSVAGIFWTLSQGGTLLLPAENLRQNLSLLPALIAEHAVSHLLSVPTLYEFILTYANPEQLISLRAVIVAGESCPLELAQRHSALLPETAFVNEYGPTEATVWCSAYAYCSNEAASPLPIGRPIANTSIYILGPHLQLQPPGLPGEIAIGGSGLARGYLHRPDLTAERFVPDAIDGLAGARLYRTGDLGRYRRDGTLEFLGRRDRQVKVRGYRIELEEIESVLREHPAVKACAILLSAGPTNQQRLIAYIVGHDPVRSPSEDDLRTYLQQRLPDYMLPAMFVNLDALPLTPSGKLDRRALPLPEEGAQKRRAGHVLPGNNLEKCILRIWQEVLGLEEISTDRNFFDLGGHSLLMAEAHSKLQAALSREIALIELFRHTTIRSLAHYLQEHSDMGTALTQSQVRGQNRKEALAQQKQLRRQRRQ